MVREWISGIYHCRPHAGLADPDVPGLDLSPAEMLAHGTARAGRLKIPAHPGMVFDFLPVAWSTIQHIRSVARAGCPWRRGRSALVGSSRRPRR